MKLFSVTVEAWNECYVQTLLVKAENKEDVKMLVVKWRKENHRTEHLKLLSEIKEVNLEDNQVKEIWFGHNESDCCDLYD